MTDDRVGHAVLLVLGGVGAGLTGSMAGLASLVSYPALLAVGIPPVAANVTNTVALLSNTVGAAAASPRELSGQRARLARLAALAVVGGLAGAVLLLVTPPSAFERIVPALIATGSVALLLRNPLRRWADRRTSGRRPAADGRPAAGRLGLPLAVAILLISVYGGYFGAAAGVLMLAALSLAATEPLAVSNAVKNVTLGAANLAAAVLYAVLAPVHWLAAAALAGGCLLGSWMGPKLVRRLPERPLRVTIALCGLALAAYLY